MLPRCCHDQHWDCVLGQGVATLLTSSGERAGPVVREQLQIARTPPGPTRVPAAARADWSDGSYFCFRHGNDGLGNAVAALP